MSVANAKSKLSVAVIGGGIAGLSCASTLSSTGRFEPVVFDTGRLRPGGRCSSRLPGDKPKDLNASRGKVLNGVVIDHAAQILTVPKGEAFEEFGAQVAEWEERRVVRKFPNGGVCDILSDRRKQLKGRDTRRATDEEKARIPFRLREISTEKNGVAFYYGVNGMNSIPAAIAASSSFELHQDVWVSPSNGATFTGTPSTSPKWKIKASGRTLGTFDRLVIAHNGKCADRLLSRSPAKALHSLLRTNFSPTVPAWGGKRMTLNSIYSLTFAVKASTSPLSKALPDSFMSGFVRNEPNLRFLTCQTRKYPTSGDVEVWTVLSSSKFGKRHKAPQENLPGDVVNEVTGLLLGSVERCLDLDPAILTGPEGTGDGVILESRLQLWGAAVPINTWVVGASERDGKSDSDNADAGATGFLYDAEFGVGACGDWLLDPSIGGAWESGRRLAHWMLSGEESVGLPPDGAFRVSKAAAEAGIGSLR